MLVAVTIVYLTIIAVICSISFLNIVSYRTWKLPEGLSLCALSVVGVFSLCLCSFSAFLRIQGRLLTISYTNRDGWGRKIEFLVVET